MPPERLHAEIPVREGRHAGSGRPGDRTPDAAASLTITAVAVLALGAAWFLPWWFMNSRAPQYGQRVLVVAVGPRAVSGDLREMDMLGHYVGIRSMESFARIERMLAPLGMAGVLGGVLLAPWVTDPSLVRERLRPGPGGKDCLFTLTFLPVGASQFVVAGLDVGRFHWSDTVPAAIVSVSGPRP